MKSNILVSAGAAISLLELERNQSLTLYNRHFALDIPAAILPTQIEVGGMHCKIGKPPPKVVVNFFFSFYHFINNFLLAYLLQCFQ